MKNEIKVGILGIVTLFVAVFGYKYLKGSNLLDSSWRYYVRFRDVGQMDASAPVLTRGFKVGSVTKINIDPESPDWILVTIEVNKEIKLPKSTKAILVSQGLMGGKAIILQFDKSCTDDCLENKSNIPGEIAGMLSSMFSKDEVKDYTQAIGNELNTLLDTSVVNQNKELAGTIKNIHIILDNLAKSTSSIKMLLDHSNTAISHSMQNLEQVTNTLAKNSESISQSIKNLDKISSSIAQADPGKMLKSADATLVESKKSLQELTSTLEQSKQTISHLNNILTDVNSGKGSLGKLINDPSLYQNLNRSSKNLDLLLQDLRLNPKRYIHVSVFGGNNTKYEVPEHDPAIPDNNKSLK